MNASVSVQFTPQKNVRGMVGAWVQSGLKNVVDNIKTVAQGNITSTSFRGNQLRSGIVAQLLSPNSAEVRGTYIASKLTELGGQVRPVKMQWLAIPVKPAAKEIGKYGYGPRAAGVDLFFVKLKKKPGTALLATSAGKGKLDVWYILKKVTNHTARPFLGPALKSSLGSIPGWFVEGANRAVVR